MGRLLLALCFPLSLSACSHDLESVRAKMDAGRDGGVATEDASVDAAASPDAEVTCDPEVCTTDMPCRVARCEEALCLVEDMCMQGEECCNGACVTAGCDDAVACTDDSCDDTAGCVNTLNDGTCTDSAGGTCDAMNGCQYPNCAMTCVAGPCETVRCDGETCVRETTCGPAQECCVDQCVAAGCDDGNECTSDSCGAAACEHVNNTAPCDDGDACNGSDTCRNGTCSDHGSPPGDGTGCGSHGGWRCCGGSCANTRVDEDNCGGCGLQCGGSTCRTVRGSGSCDDCAGTGGGSCPGSSGWQCEGRAHPTLNFCECTSSSACASGQSCNDPADTRGVSVCVY